MHVIKKIIFSSRREQLQQQWCSLDEPWTERAAASDDAFTPSHLYCTEGSKEDETRGQLHDCIHLANRAASTSACASPTATTPTPPGCYWLQVLKDFHISVILSNLEITICSCCCCLLLFVLSCADYEVLINTELCSIAPRLLGCWHRGNKLRPVSSKNGLACSMPRWGTTCSKRRKMTLLYTEYRV